MATKPKTVMWARLDESGHILEVTDINPAGRFHASIVWTPMTQSVEPGGVFSNGTYTPPEPAPVVELPDPGKPAVPSVDFMRRLTLPERTALRASTDPLAIELVWLINNSATIKPDDADVVAMVEHLPSVNVIAADRVAAILA